jgi:hypothetical protein
MLPEAKSGNLLYVSDVGTNEVYVFTYPQGTLVGALSGFSYPIDLCADIRGHIFIVDQQLAHIVEYAHGGTTPIRTLVLEGPPLGCSVDNRTGNLAVTFSPPSALGGVAVFKRAHGIPTVYLSHEETFSSCGYDNNDNLFLDGYAGSETAFWELAKGSNAFTNLTIQNSPFKSGHFAGQVQWDGQYVTVESLGLTSGAIYRLQFSGSTGTVVGRTRFRKRIRPEAMRESWIQGRLVVIAISRHYATPGVAFWRYPAGGEPTKILTGNGLKGPVGAAVSLAPR